MTIVMPLGVLANQLVKIEGDLRFLSMKVSEDLDEGSPRSRKAVDARVDLIQQALEGIQAQLVKLQGDIHPRGAAARPAAHHQTDEETYKLPPEEDD